jgi:hypothetical protein
VAKCHKTRFFPGGRAIDDTESNQSSFAAPAEEFLERAATRFRRSDDPEKIQPRFDSQHWAVRVGAYLIGAADLAALAEVPESSFLSDDLLHFFRGKNLPQRSLGLVKSHKRAGEME